MNEFPDLIEHLFEGVYIVNKERKIIFWNSGSEKITGYSAQEVMNSHCYNNILRHVTFDGVELCFGGCPLHKTLQTGEVQENLVFLHHKEGYRIPVSVKTLPIYDQEGNITAAVEVFTDERFQSNTYQENRKLKEMLTIDDLTKIPNRRYLEFQLDTLVREYQEFESDFAVVFFDIDHFKYVNDTYGHDVGDEVLKVVANTLKNNIRSLDTIGRWGGEEFLGLVKIDSLHKLKKVTEKLRMLVEKSGYKISKTDEIKVTISIGATLYKKGEKVEDTIKRADTLMYMSKDNGRNKCTIK